MKHAPLEHPESIFLLMNLIFACLGLWLYKIIYGKDRFSEHNRFWIIYSAIWLIGTVITALFLIEHFHLFPQIFYFGTHA
ncbi:hypothetical protein [Neisseria sp. Ec49-e6-T10]|uniref:hypothetical protein n=1 Tax=Neisseria sp. Ec49-e6-T10 TaxID=3140744 RepID=UPI003EC0526E